MVADGHPTLANKVSLGFGSGGCKQGQRPMNNIDAVAKEEAGCWDQEMGSR
jgi:hypothetical protein